MEQASQEILQTFFEHQVSLSFPQKPATGSKPEPDESCTYH